VFPRATSTPDGSRRTRSVPPPEHPPGPSLDLDQDLSFERRSWTFQRVGWATIAALIAAALLGVFGGGPLSWARVSSGPLHVEYPRFARLNAPTELAVELPGAEREGEPAVLWLGRAWLDRVRVQSVTPTPMLETRRPDRLVYVFPTWTSGERLRVTLRVEPEKVGVVRAQAGDGGENSVSFWQLVYP
jgi:hypothetical protein